MTAPIAYADSAEERLLLRAIARAAVEGEQAALAAGGSAGAAAPAVHDALVDIIADMRMSAAAGARPTASIAASALAQRRAELHRQQPGQQQQPAAAPPCPPHRIPPTQLAAFPQPRACAFLRPGQVFEGRQRVSHLHHHGLGAPVKQEHWEVQAQIQRLDLASGYIAGTMEAANVPDALAPVRTFFEGEINVNHSFYTADWDACADTDFKHWSKFEPFQKIHAEVVKHGGRCPSLASHSHVYMRWKEQFFLTGSECRLTIAGFYYLACNRITGQVLGYYFDLLVVRPKAGPDGGASRTRRLCLPTLRHRLKPPPGSLALYC